MGEAEIRSTPPGEFQRELDAGRLPRRPLSAWKILWFSCVATFLGLALLELLARAFIAPFAPPPAMPFDPRLLWKMTPGVRNESGVSVTINALGLRGPSLSETPPTGTERILTLGDSTVFGFGVAQHQVFSSVLAETLNALPERPPSVVFEAVNGGMVGYSSLQSLHLLEDKGGIIRPSLVVIANLWSDNNFDTFVDRELMEQQSRSNAAWQTDSRARLRASRLFVGLERWLSGDGTRKVGWVQKGQAPTQSIASYLATLGERNRRRVPVQEYVQHLEAMIQWTRDHRAEAILLMLPHLTDARGLPESTFFWSPYRDAMRKVAMHKGVPLIEMPSVAAKLRGKAGDLFLDDLHPSVQGHALIAKTIANWLQSAGWAKDPRTALRSREQAMAAVIDPFESEGRPTTESPAGPERFLRALEGRGAIEFRSPAQTGSDGNSTPMRQDSHRMNQWSTMPVQPPPTTAEHPANGITGAMGPGPATEPAGMSGAQSTGARPNGTGSAADSAQAHPPNSQPYTGKPPTLSRPFIAPPHNP